MRIAPGNNVLLIVVHATTCAYMLFTMSNSLKLQTHFLRIECGFHRRLGNLRSYNQIAFAFQQVRTKELSPGILTLPVQGVPL